MRVCVCMCGVCVFVCVSMWLSRLLLRLHLSLVYTIGVVLHSSRLSPIVSFTLPFANAFLPQTLDKPTLQRLMFEQTLVGGRGEIEGVLMFEQTLVNGHLAHISTNILSPLPLQAFHPEAAEASRKYIPKPGAASPAPAPAPASKASSTTGSTGGGSSSSSGAARK